MHLDIVVREGLDNLKATRVFIIEAVHDENNIVDSILAKMGIVSQKTYDTRQKISWKISRKTLSL